jgi:Putative zinc-finger
LISQIQDGGVPFGQRLRVRIHLLWCDACKEFERHVMFLRVVMRRYRQ